jgi:hypothetical protein
MSTREPHGSSRRFRAGSEDRTCPRSGSDFFEDNETKRREGQTERCKEQRKEKKSNVYPAST